MTHTKPSSTGLHHSLLQLGSPARFRESLVLQRPASLRAAWAVGLQAAAAVIAAAVLLHLSPWHQWAAHGGLGALAALYGRFSPAPQRRMIVLHAGALLVASVLSVSLLSLLASTMMHMLLLFALVAGVIAAWSHHAQLGLPGVVIFIFAGSAALTPAASGQEVAARSLATAIGVAMALLMGLLTERLRLSDGPHKTVAIPTPAHTAADSSSSHFWHKHPLLRVGLSVALCSLVATQVAHAFGLAHPAWAAIGAVAVVQGSHLHIAMHRAWQRTLGTIVGAGIAWLVLSQHPSFYQILLAVAVLQVITEVVIGYNYALGQMAITPMALLMTALAAHSDALEIATARIYDTALGAVVGIVLALLLSTLQERQSLAKHHHQR
ncbi:FUSC family protein [Lampropedia aestuarii]|uniref:FUSC family protein n=1 Tax=Lampropedia aestuarii TaxID=2562762 RepID=UPI0024684C8C|nr:FUSC family protein [Lampropedia aestuarii]MDH5858566.1 FUSC family protein [Lampropedia aestuarii]